jgi:K+-sensing histidine kinase KdpD
MNSTVERGISHTHATIPPRIFSHAVFRYGFAVVSVAVALSLGLLAGQHDVPNVQFTFFLFVFALTTWYTGPGPGIVAFVLGSLAFNYFFYPAAVYF